MCYCNPQLPVTLQGGLSGVGIDGVLLQNDQPVACYSNTATATKQPYTVTKKEYLAIFLAFEKWDSLLYEKSTTKSSASQEYLQETSTKNHGDYKP